MESNNKITSKDIEVMNSILKGFEISVSIENKIVSIEKTKESMVESNEFNAREGFTKVYTNVVEKYTEERKRKCIVIRYNNEEILVNFFKADVSLILKKVVAVLHKSCVKNVSSIVVSAIYDAVTNSNTANLYALITSYNYNNHNTLINCLDYIANTTDNIVSAAATTIKNSMVDLYERNYRSTSEFKAISKAKIKAIKDANKKPATSNKKSAVTDAPTGEELKKLITKYCSSEPLKVQVCELAKITVRNISSGGNWDLADPVVQAFVAFAGGNN